MKNFFKQLALLNRGARSFTLWAHLGLTLGCAIVFFGFILGHAGMLFLKRQILGTLPGQELRVGPRKEDVALFRRTIPGSPEQIAAKDLEAMAGLPGVVGVWPLRYGNQPAKIQAQILTASFKTDIVLQGIDPHWIRDQVPLEKLTWKPGKTVPLVVNPQILAVYNGGYARSQNMPELSAEALKLPVLTIQYGSSGSNGTPLTLKARVVGYSPKVALGLAFPEQVLDYLHQSLGIEPAPVTEAAVEMAPNASANPVRVAIEEMGFAVAEPDALARALEQVRQVGLGAGMLIVIGLCLFGGVFLNQTLRMVLLFKRRDYAVCRAMGMSARRLKTLLTAEWILTILLDLGLGLLLGYGSLAGLHHFWLNRELLHLVGVSFALEIHWPGILIIALVVLVAAMGSLLPRIWNMAGRPVGSLLTEGRR